MPIAFISHSSEDRSFIESEILPRLKAHKIDVWYSPHDIQTAEDWERSIKAGLQNSDVFVVMMSPPAALSPWVQAELHWAFTERPNRVVPVMLRSCDPKACHLSLGPLQYVDYVSGDTDKATEEMAAAISRARSAEPAGDTAIKLDVSNAEAYHTRGVLRWRILQHDEALGDFSEYIRLEPSSVEGYAQRAQVYRDLGNFERARADFQTVRALNPAAYVPEQFLADDRASTEGLRIEEALRTLRVVGRLIKMNALPAAAQAQLLAEIERIGFPKAIADVEYVLQHLPKDQPEHDLAEIVIGPLKEAWADAGTFNPGGTS